MKLHSMISCHIGANPCCCGSSILQYNDLSLTSIISLLLLLSTDSVRAQSIRPSGSQDDPYYNKFGPSMGVTIIILIFALFFMGFFFIYIRRYSSAAAAARNRGSVARSRPNQEGLDPTVIESFPTFDYSAVRSLHIGNGAFECAVCLNEFEDDETLRLIPKCDHVFHPECIDDWLVAHPTCPLCRTNLVPQPGEFIHALELGQIREHSSDQDGAVVGFPDQQYGSHHQSMNANVDEESVEHPLHTPPPQPGVADFSTRRLNRNRTRHNISGRPKLFDRFLRSNSTGHVAVKQWENLVRLTLKVVEQIGKQTMSGKLSRSTSLVGLPRESSSRRGYRPGFGGGVGEGSGRGGSFTWRLDRYSSRPVHGRPADAGAQGIRSRRAADFNIFYTKPYGPGFGGGVGEGSGRGRRFTGRLCGYASRQVQGRTPNTAAQGLRFRRASDSGIFYSTLHQPGLGRGVGERNGWGGRIIRPLDGYASRPVHSRPADTAAQGQRCPRARDLGIFYSTTYRPGFGGGVGEGRGRGGGRLKGYTNRSEQSRSTSSAAQSFLTCRASDFETSCSARSQASFDREAGEGSSRSTGTAAKDSDSETSFITCPDRRFHGRLDRYAGVSNQSRSTGNAAKDSGSKTSYSTSTTRHMKTKYRK